MSVKEIVSAIFILIIVFYLFRNPKATGDLVLSSANAGTNLIKTLQGR